MSSPFSSLAIGMEPSPCDSGVRRAAPAAATANVSVAFSPGEHRPVRRPSKTNVPDRLEGVAEDRRLVLLARGGDRSAFGELVLKYSGVVRALTAARLGRGADAEDAAQETFLLAFDRLDRLDDPERFAGWLSTIAVNSALMRLRQADRRRAASLAALPSEPADEGAPVSARLEDTEDMERLAALVATLDEKTQAVLAL